MIIRRYSYTYLYFIISVSFLLTDICYSQNTSFEKVTIAFNSKNNDLIREELKKIDTSKISKYDKATWLFYYADYQSKIDNQHVAYQAIIDSKGIFKSLKRTKDVTDCNILLLSILSHQNDLEIDHSSIIKELEHDGYKNSDTSALKAVYHKIASTYWHADKNTESLKYFRKYLTLNIHLKDTLKIAHSYMNIGIVYSDIGKIDSSLYFLKRAVPTLKKYNDLPNLAINYNNQANQYKIIDDYKKAIKYYNKADSIPLTDNIIKTKIIFYDNISDLYYKTGDYKNAATYLKKVNGLKDSINDIGQNIKIAEIKEKYDLSEEEKQKIINRNIAIILGILLLFGFILFFLIQKNNKKKQEIEKQKVSTLLKDQEINSINAMIEGQEKERQRIANDLHDDLGGLMATIKLQFNTLQEQQTPDLFDKTNNLLDQAYNKIRSIAHAKNSGVIAKQGLLKAVKNMAHNVSSASVINIEVTDFGLESRLENSLELSIFRIIQELTTNIIKHAEATHATISLTNHENSLNIMIEDNGKGFNAKKVVRNNGMGLHSIEKRVEHLEGELKIESQINQGATIIIDIPL